MWGYLMFNDWFGYRSFQHDIRIKHIKNCQFFRYQGILLKRKNQTKKKKKKKLFWSGQPPKAVVGYKKNIIKSRDLLGNCAALNHSLSCTKIHVAQRNHYWHVTEYMGYVIQHTHQTRAWFNF